MIMSASETESGSDFVEQVYGWSFVPITKILLSCRKQLCKALCKVSVPYSHKKNVEWRFGFYCPGGLQRRCPQPAVSPAEENTQYKPEIAAWSDKLRCGDGIFFLEDKYKSWFQVRNYGILPKNSTRIGKLLCCGLTGNNTDRSPSYIYAPPPTTGTGESISTACSWLARRLGWGYIYDAAILWQPKLY